MDELEIKGKKYISSKRASELTGYAKDYIGQLARSGKLPGMRMGRAWYVEEAALLGNRAPETEKQEEKETVFERISQKSPQPTQKKSISPATLKALGYVPTSLPSTWGDVSYTAEEGEFIPRPARARNVSEQSGILMIPQRTPDSVEREVRIQILQGRFRQEPLNRRPARPIAEKALKIKQKRRHIDAGVSLGVLTAALGVFLFFASGFFVGSNISLSGHEGGSSANILVGYEYVRDFLSQYPPFQAGVHALGGFFSVLFTSFGDFVLRTLEFLKTLLNFTFGN